MPVMTFPKITGITSRADMNTGTNEYLSQSMTRIMKLVTGTELIMSTAGEMTAFMTGEMLQRAARTTPVRQPVAKPQIIRKGILWLYLYVLFELLKDCLACGT